MKVTRFTSFDALSTAAAALLMRYVQAEADHPLGIMLSGGKTPMAAYDTVAKSGVRASDCMHLMFTDERMVPSASPQSNYGNTEKMVSALKIPDSRVIRVHTDLRLDSAAEQYNDDLADFFNRGGTIPLGLLGLGADGHTASIFTMEDLHADEPRLACSVSRLNGYDRVTITPRVIEHIERAVFLVSGPEKQAIVARLLQSPETLPAGAAVAKAGQVELWMAVW